ncbi:hypothetical protein FHT02_003329 [Sphingomonas xinjiangensis]|uniref:Uncharacterized protein n=1 Tax=Sphingomonas xinjiangensis TaxID=643568 RepID=A0A840YRP6_9SPHN|nr:hypothetical protein [Sphingomonas xinjiangensis]
MDGNREYEAEKTTVGWIVYQHATVGTLMTSVPVSREFDTRKEAEAEIQRLLSLPQ